MGTAVRPTPRCTRVPRLLVTTPRLSAMEVLMDMARERPSQDTEATPLDHTASKMSRRSATRFHTRTPERFPDRFATRLRSRFHTRSAENPMFIETSTPMAMEVTTKCEQYLLLVSWLN